MDECDECGKRRMLCPYHRFSKLVMQSNYNILKQKFIEICYDREFNTYNVIRFLARMIREGDIKEKGDKFVTEMCRFAMMGVRGKRMRLSYINPSTITLFLKNARLPFYLYKNHLHEEHFHLCLANSYPLNDSLNACYKNKDYTKIIKIIKKISHNRDLYLQAFDNLPTKITRIILKFIE